MRRFIILSLFCFVLSVIVLIHCSPAGDQPTEISQEMIRAVEGDTVWVIFNYVKPDMQADFEKFHDDIFFPIIDKLSDPGEKRQMDNIRYLHPFSLRRDSTFVYIYAADPYYRGGSTNHMAYLKREYSDEQAQEYYSLFTESHAKPQEGYLFIETDICRGEELERAAEGDSTWFVLNRIKPGKEADFEHFVFDILWGVKEFEKDPLFSKTFIYTRFLKPVKPNEDGSSTYMFFMDPWITGADYGFNTLFEKYYTPEQIKEYLDLYSSCIVEPARSFTVRQTEH